MSSYAAFRSANTLASVLAEARTLTDTPVDDEQPYALKYKARELLEKTLGQLDGWRGGAEAATPPSDLEVDIARVRTKLGANFLDTEENSDAERHLAAALEVLERECTEERGYPHLMALLDVINLTAMLWSAREEVERANVFLERAHGLARRVRRSHPDLVDDEFESMYTHILYYRAQAYGHLGDSTRSSRYCHITLKRQIDGDRAGVDRLEWAKNCMQLAGYYLTNDEYGHAEHCLKAVDEMLPEDVDATHKANLQVLWARFYLGLLRASKSAKEGIAIEGIEREELEFERTMSRGHLESSGELPPVPEDGGDPALAAEQSGDGDGSGEGEEEDDYDISLINRTLLDNLPVPQLSKQLANKYSEARSFFLRGMDYLNKAKEFFVLDGYVTDHVNVLQESSQMYKLLSFFETDTDRKVKMLKRRVNLLEPVVHQLNATHYVDIIRQMLFEIAETFQEIADIRYKQNNAAPPGQQPVSAKKLNEYIINSIKYYQLFLATFQTPDDSGTTSKDPERVDEVYVDSYISARFCLARLFPKIMLGDSNLLRANLIRSLNEYQWIMDFHKKNNLEQFQEEMGVCKEMLELLPIKISNIERIVRQGNAF